LALVRTPCAAGPPYPAANANRVLEVTYVRKDFHGILGLRIPNLSPLAADGRPGGLPEWTGRLLGLSGISGNIAPWRSQSTCRSLLNSPACPGIEPRRGRLQKLGLYRETGHEHFNGSVVIPIFNQIPIFNLEADVVQIYGRKITRALREGTPLHMYLPGPHRGVWNDEALAASREIILCEALELATRRRPMISIDAH